MKKKTSKQKGILAASVLVAGAIVAGGTFAWFTSKDEVVNQLSASNQYDVAITESFKSPSSWIPGQKVSKEVAAVNTGNVDAFVKMSVTNSLDLTTLDTIANRPDELTSNEADAKETYADVNKYVTLNREEGSDEVKSLQAGGVLAGAWYYDSNTTGWKEITTSEGDNQVSILGATGTEFTPSTTGLYLFKRDQKDTTTTTTDASSNSSSTTTTRTYTYVGYYYVQDAATEDGKVEPGKGTYYALSNVPTKTDAAADATVVDENGYLTGEAVLTEVPAKVSYQIKKTETVTPVLKYVAAEPAVEANSEPKTDAKEATPAYIQATYDPDDTGTEDYKDDNEANNIVININLSKYADGWNTAKDVVVADTTDDTWTYIESTDSNSKLTPTFYYNKLVAAGATSDLLIDSITLDSSVTEDAYYSFDYNLAIQLASVQVTDKEGKQSNDAVVSEWTEVKSELTWGTTDTTKIDTIEWTDAAAK